jgi:hypothetical protein
MTALLTIRLAGSVVQSCDARCYNAKHDDCDCCCEKANHGVGLEQATANARQMWAVWADRAIRGKVGDEFEVSLTALHEPLF